MEKGPYTVTITAFVDEADQWGNSWPVPEISSDLREIGYQIVGWPENRLENSGDQAGDEARDLYGIIKFTIPKDKQKSLEESDNPKQLVLLQFRSVLDKYSTSLNNIQVQGFEKTSGDNSKNNNGKDTETNFGDQLWRISVVIGTKHPQQDPRFNWTEQDFVKFLEKYKIKVQKINIKPYNRDDNTDTDPSEDFFGVGIAPNIKQKMLELWVKKPKKWSKEKLKKQLRSKLETDKGYKKPMVTDAMKVESTKKDPFDNMSLFELLPPWVGYAALGIGAIGILYLLDFEIQV